MRSQVAFDDPNGPRAPLRSNFDNPDGWEPTESPGDQLFFPTSVVGQTGEVQDRVCWFVHAIRGGTGIPSWKGDSHVQHLRDDFPALQRHSVRFRVVKMPLLPYLDVPVGFLGVTCRVNSRHPVVKIQSRKSARSITNLRTTNWGKSHEHARGPKNAILGSRFGPLCAQRVEMSCPTRLVSMDQEL